jgi:molybdate transport system regulatory protein
MVSLSIRVDLSETRGIGPGKIRLLEMIAETGSISAAGRAMDMSYRRAWLLLDELNHMFREPVATTAQGGRAGGGARLTPFGKRLVQGYRKMEGDAQKAAGAYLSLIGGATASSRQGRVPKRSLAK